MTAQKRKPDYKWIIFGCCFLLTFICLGFCSSNKGLYLTAMSEALGIKRSLLSINDSFRFVTSGIINLFFGSLVHRFGLRKMVAFGFSSLLAALLVYATANNVYTLYLGGILLGLGLAFASTTMASSIMRRWFQKDIGKYTGIVFAANGIGGAIAAQIISPMINEEGNPFGYRKSYLVVAVIVLITGIVVVALLRERPKDTQSNAVTVSKKKKRGDEWAGIDFQTAKHRPYFYLVVVCVLLTGFILQGIGGAYAAHMKDVGLSAGYIATVASLFSLALTLSKILVGAMYDRFGLKTVMILCQASTVVAFLTLVFLDASVTGMVLGVVFGLLYALALPLETLIIPLIVNDLFGSASYDKILGIMAGTNYVGYALGAPLVNLCYDVFGSYKPALLLFSALMIPISIVFQYAIRCANKTRRCGNNINKECHYV